MQPAISLRSVTKQYAAGSRLLQVLDGITFDVWTGEVVLIMGPSGSGKTTLLSIMGCLLQPTAGAVLINGLDVSKMAEPKISDVRLKEIGFVFQEFNLFKSLSAGENVEFALELKGARCSDIRKAAECLLERVGLRQAFDAYPADLSGGEKQRAAIARALAGNPRILLADEPTSALDRQSRATVMEIFAGIARSSMHCVVMVTHDRRLVEYADRVVELSDGRVREPYVNQNDYSERRSRLVHDDDSLCASLGAV